MLIGGGHTGSVLHSYPFTLLEGYMNATFSAQAVAPAALHATLFLHYAALDHIKRGTSWWVGQSHVQKAVAELKTP